ncbi:MAG: pilus (MSHA type) biogenesis protein MshL [marine bacterium B5-7]|nr:MAG: pilus (MSHA type) biogenesis protein MshL [marine bacterium B5-7]
MDTHKLKRFAFGATLLLLTACTNHLRYAHQNTVANANQVLVQGAALDKQTVKEQRSRGQQEAKPHVPRAVSSLLLPSDNDAQADKMSIGKRFDIAVKEVPAQTFFLGLVQDAKESIVVSPAISGKITLNMKAVTLPNILNAVKELYGYEFTKTSFGYEVFPRKMETHVFYISRLDVDREGSSSMSINSSNLTSASASSNSGTSGSSVKTTSKSAFWVELKSSLSLLINLDTDKKSTKGAAEKEKPSLAISQDTGTIVIRAYPKQLRAVAKFLSRTQGILKREVIIEAKILDVQLDDQFSSGINWNLLKASSSGSPTLLPAVSGMLTNIFALSASAGNNFSAAINLLSSQGDVSVLSSPRISTLNNQKAVIKVGKDSYFITNVSVDTTTTSGANSQVAGITLEPFFSGVALDVTPEIDKNDNVTLHIHPVISRVVDETKEVSLGDTVTKMPLASSTVREVDSIVRAHTGQVIIIGGLMDTTTTHKRAGLPVPDRFQGVNKLLANKDDTVSKDELIILLRPIVVKPSTWGDQLEGASDNIFKGE